MIETVLDGNNDDKFLGHSYPVVTPAVLLAAPFSAYLQEAQKIISAHVQDRAVIIPENDTHFSINKLALALFIASGDRAGNLEFAVFKVKNRTEKTEAYKPYVALTIAIKYIMRIIAETPQNALKDIACLGYLGLNIKQDYAQKKLFMSLSGQTPLQKINALNYSETLIAVGILKALALTQNNFSLAAEIDTQNYDMPLNQDEVIMKIIEYVMPLID